MRLEPLLAACTGADSRVLYCVWSVCRRASANECRYEGHIGKQRRIRCDQGLAIILDTVSRIEEKVEDF